MAKNFRELRSKMSPTSQERARLRAEQWLTRKSEMLLDNIAGMSIPIGSFWRDRDRRSASGNRIVRVTLVAYGYVTYANRLDDTSLNRSRLQRFVKAFERVEFVGGDAVRYVAPEA